MRLAIYSNEINTEGVYQVFTRFTETKVFSSFGNIQDGVEYQLGTAVYSLDLAYYLIESKKRIGYKEI